MSLFLKIDIASLMLIVFEVWMHMKMSVSKRIEEFVLMPLFYHSVLQLKDFIAVKRPHCSAGFICIFFLWSMESRAEMKNFERKTKGSLHSKTALLLLSCIKSQRSPKTGDKN